MISRKIIVCGGRKFGEVRSPGTGSMVAREAIGQFPGHEAAIIEAYAERELLNVVLSQLVPEHAEVITGGATGADQYAARWAHQNGRVSTVVPAEWERYGRKAGPLRNRKMLDLEPHLVIAFPGGRGTRNMISQARIADVPVAEVTEEGKVLIRGAKIVDKAAQ